MSILAKLFKKPSPPSLEQQIAAISAYDQAQLIDTALNSEEEKLRLTAIDRMTDVKTLVSLSVSDAKAVNAAARRRIAGQLDTGKITLQAVRAEVPDEAALLSLCALSTTAAPALVASLSDEANLAQLAADGASTQIRQAAAEKIESQAVLQNLLKQIKGKDKAVYRIVKNKLSLFKEAERVKQLALEEVRAVCVQAETLAKRPIDDIFHARKAQIEEAWGNIASDIPAAERGRYEEAMQRCQAALDAIEAEAKAEQAAIAADKAAKKELYEALGNLESLVAELFTHATPGELEGVIQEAQNKVETGLDEAQQRGLRVAAEQNQYIQLQARSQAILKSLEGHGSFPSLLDGLDSEAEGSMAPHSTLSDLFKYAKAHLEHQPDWLVDAEKRFKAWREASKEKRQAQKANIDKAFDLIRKGRIAIDRGQSGRVRAIDRDLQETLEAIDAIPPVLQEKVEGFKEHMSKLGDWHEFATKPKKEQLIADMQALKDSPLPPGDLAKKIQSLQAQWKTLTRGGIHQDDALWQQFQQASDQAYEPCKTHFDQEHQQRTNNLANREQLIEQMRSYLQAYDWENANWPEVENTLKVAREAWQSYWPIPRKETERVQTAFDTVMDDIYAHLNGYYEKNKAKKQALVQQAEKLNELNDTTNAIEKAKLLQAQWQQIGKCKYKDDQSLWKDFRKHCDQLFEKRQQDYEAQKTKRNEALTEAQNIVKQIEAIAKLDQEAFFSQRAQVETLSEQFQALEELPRGQAEKVKQQFQSALKQVDAKAESFVRAQEKSMWADIFAALVNAEDSLPAKCPAKIREAFEKRAETSTSDGERQMRMLCVDAELRHDINVPDSDKALKMAMQVEQLQKHPGQRPPSDAEAMKEHVAEWVKYADTSSSQYHELETRFKTAWGLS